MALRTLVALFGTLAFAGTACGGTERATGGDADDSRTPAAARRASLSVQATNPLVVAGTGFTPLERVNVSAGGQVREVRAGGRGRFVIRFTDVETCSGIVLLARGSRGSRAQLSFSSKVDNVHCL